MPHLFSNKAALGAYNCCYDWQMLSVLRECARTNTDCIINFSLGALKKRTLTGDPVDGLVTASDLIKFEAEKLGINAAIWTDHCEPKDVDFLERAIAVSQTRVDAGGEPLVTAHMFDGGALELGKNLEIAIPLLKKSVDAQLGLEVEIGRVLGEEDGVEGGETEEAYTEPGHIKHVVELLKDRPELLHRLALAAIFGNKHGAYKPGAGVELRPDILSDGQRLVGELIPDFRLPYVFHGGTGTSPEDVAATIDAGVVKQNVDTQLQLSAGLAVLEHMLQNAGMIFRPFQWPKEAKKACDPRKWVGLAMDAIGVAVGEANDRLNATGKHLDIAS